jgi:hypothetical protein
MTYPPSARQYLVEHNPAAVLAYNQALHVIAQLADTKLEGLEHSDQNPTPAIHSQKAQTTNGIPRTYV